ncbi:MAG: hypothetical protein QOG65_1298 [Actinomycetota bacterium]|jgi:hypothetical protein|nr:hypothetical protein [Actinomycetota bacterium]
MTRRNGIAVEVQLSVNLDERHRTPVASEHGERSGPQMLAPERMRAAGDGRDRRGAASMRDAETLHDVPWIDAGPHGDAQLRKACAHIRELDGKGSLRVVQRRRLLE